MTVLAFGNRKGGVGKTTSALYYAAFLARRLGPGRVAVVDRDETTNVTKMRRRLPDYWPAGVDSFVLDLEEPLPPGYDYVIVDTPPRVEIAKYMWYVDRLIVPCPPEPQAVELLPEYLRDVGQECHNLPGLRLIAILPTMVQNNNNLHRQFLARMRAIARDAEAAPRVLTPVRRLIDITRWDFTIREYDQPAREVLDDGYFAPPTFAAD
jgi:cellulose biosynthesis protein BcsQ